MTKHGGHFDGDRLLHIAEIEIAVVEVKIGMAEARAGDAHQRLARTDRLRGEIHRCQRRAEHRHGLSFHACTIARFRRNSTLAHPNATISRPVQTRWMSVFSRARSKVRTWDGGQ